MRTYNDMNFETSDTENTINSQNTTNRLRNFYSAQIHDGALIIPAYDKRRRYAW